MGSLVTLPNDNIYVCDSQLIDEQLGLPETDRVSVVEPTVDTDRYCIRRQSTDVLRGLKGIINEAISNRRDYLNFALSRLEHYVRGKLYIRYLV